MRVNPSVNSRAATGLTQSILNHYALQPDINDPVVLIVFNSFSGENRTVGYGREKWLEF